MAEIFDIDLESGSLTGGDEFTGATTNGGNIYVSSDVKNSGTYGVKCDVYDGDPQYAYETVTDTDRFRTRFYINFENYTLVNWGTLTFIGIFSGTWVVARIRLYNSNSTYKLRYTYRTDAGTETSSADYDIPSGFLTGWHYVEIDFKISSGAGNNDGFFKVWIDSSSVYEITTIDNDTEYVRHLYVGSVFGFNTTDSGYTGYDDIVGNDDGSEIGPAQESVSSSKSAYAAGKTTATSSKSAYLTGPETKYHPPIESEANNNDGTKNEYGTPVDPDGDLNITTAAAMGGSPYGLAITVDDTAACYIWRVFTDDSGLIRVRFYFDPNSITMGSNSEWSTFAIYRTGGVPAASIWFNYYSGSYRLQSVIVTDSGYSTSSYYAISDEPHWVEIELKRETTSDSNDGYLSMWVDDTLKETLSGKDNYAAFPDVTSVAVGVITGAYIVPTTNGTYYIDEIAINTSGLRIGNRLQYYRNAYLKGGTGVTSSKSAYSQGTSAETPVSSSKSAYTKGQTSTSSSKPAYTKGSTGTLTNKHAYLRGEISTTGNIHAFLAGGINTSSSKSAYTKSLVPTDSSRHAFIEGFVAGVSVTPAYTRGATSTSGSSSAYLRGAYGFEIEWSVLSLPYALEPQDISSSTNVYLRGQTTSISAVSAYTEGNPTFKIGWLVLAIPGAVGFRISWLVLATPNFVGDCVSGKHAYTDGGIASSSSISACTVGFGTPVTSSGEAYTRGAITTSSTKPVYMFCGTMATSKKSAYMKGVTGGSNAKSAYLFGYNVSGLGKTITLINSDDTLALWFRVAEEGYGDGTLNRDESLTRTISGGIYHSLGTIYRTWEMVIMVRQNETDAGYGNLSQLEIFYSYKNPNGVPSNRITFIDHHLHVYTVHIVGKMSKALICVRVEGTTAWYYYNLVLREAI